MSVFSTAAKAVLPSSLTAALLRARRRLRRARVERRPLLSEVAFRRLLEEDLGLRPGDTVFVHSSIDQLNLGFPAARVLSCLRSIVGTTGTLVFPTYPRLGSYEYLLSGEIFDVRKTPSYTGVLTEIARRQPDAWRSLHPTKSVCAIGLHARELIASHQHSLHPFDSCSPYHKLMDYEGKIVGIGVPTARLSFVHCVEDAMLEEFPVAVYYPRQFEALCLNYAGEQVIVRTYAHNMHKVKPRTARFLKRQVAAEVCQDVVIGGIPFFRADAQKLFAAMMKLARDGIVIYPRWVQSRRLHTGLFAPVLRSESKEQKL